jgi:signal peptidase I
MDTYFALGLLIATVAAITIAVVDKIWFEKPRVALAKKAADFESLDKTGKQARTKAPLIADYARSLWPIFLIVFLLRSFVVEPFRIPSGSMLPGLKIGDFILVNKYDYGLRWPVWHGTFFKVGSPKRGDVVVLRFPVDPKVDFIKRVIGLPGDHVSYVNKTLFINGKKMPQKFLKNIIQPANSIAHPSKEYQETFGHKTHLIYDMPWLKARNFKNIVVPKGEYFVMGDNRDNSEDGRYWGFVKTKQLVGKAFMIWMSWDSTRYRVRWSQIGRMIK